MALPNEKLRGARLVKHWSVAVASRRVGVSSNTFNRWERGLQIPQLATLDQLCAAFDMSAEELGFGFVVSLPKLAERRFSQVEKPPGGLLTGTSAPVATHILLRSSNRVIGKEEQDPRLEQREMTGWLEEERISRRQVMAALIGTPAAIFGARQGDNPPPLHNEEILTICASHIPLCWQLYFEGGSNEVEHVLSDYIAQLTELTRYPGAYQKRAATLLSQVHQLASLLAMQHQDYGVAFAYACQGLFYGEIAEDPDLQAASLIRRAQVYLSIKRTRLRQQTYHQALQLAPHISPLLQGRIYMGLVEVYSKLSQEREAREYLALAREIFPAKAEADPSYPYTHFSLASLSICEGTMYLNLNQPELAWETFEQMDAQVPLGAVPERLELLVLQATALCVLGDLEKTCRYIETIVSMARSMESQLGEDEAYEIYEWLLEKWGNTPLLEDLENLFH